MPMVSGAATFSGTESPVSVGAGNQLDPAISGPYVVFSDFSTGNGDVYYFDSNNSSVHPVVVAPGEQQLPDISGTNIVYTDFTAGAGDLWLYDIVNATSIPISPNPADQINAVVSSTLVAWEDFRGVDLDIWVYDLALGTSGPVLLSGAQISPSASGGKVVFVNSDSGDSLSLYDHATQAVSLIHPGPVTQPDIDGERVVFCLQSPGNAEIVLISSAGAPIASLALPGDQFNPHLSGDWVAFEDNGVAGGPHVALWHVPSGELYYPAPATSQQILTDLSGQRVVYNDNRSGDFDIFAYDFERVEEPGDPPSCDDANPIATLELVRGTGKPQVASVAFTTADEALLICVDGVMVSSAWISLNDDLVVGRSEFRGTNTHLERVVSAHTDNLLTTAIAGTEGSKVTVRVFAVPEQP
jgi:beta propeller repeat protein